VDVPDEAAAADLSDEVTDQGVFRAVVEGYDAVYGALTGFDTFSRIWRENAYESEFPEVFAHIGFLTLSEGQRLVDLLGLSEGSVVVDLACGSGGPGAWVASQSGATLIGVDPSAPGLALAAQRVERVGLSQRARFVKGTFEKSHLPEACADAIMSVEALQYAPDKAAAFAEMHRLLRPGRRLAMVCFEVDPSSVEGVPVLGVDPVPNYRPLLEGAGLQVLSYEETLGWRERVERTFGAVVANAAAITTELGEPAAAAALAEATLTVEVKPYPRRVLLAAQRPT
jgi:ubiquinone/menaquinone biosynthesis C-methylase UbiE